MKSLYEINMELQLMMQQAEEQAAENDGEISEALSEMLDTLQGDRQVKIGNICRYYKSLLAEAEMVKAEADALKERAMQTGNKAEALKKYLQNMMPGETYSDSTSKVSWRKSKAVVIGVDAVIPEKYQRVKVEPDKTALKEAIAAGEEITGVSVVENNNIQIK